MIRSRKHKLSILAILFAAFLAVPAFAAKKPQKPVQDLWPDGTPIDSWFADNTKVDVLNLGQQYKLTDFHINADGRVHTKEIQELIDKAAANGGGIIVVPPGIFMTGGLHFRQNTHLHLMKGAVLMGSDFIGDYPLGKTRIEGETCTYFGALINADGLDGFTITGEGIIDGNGLKYHQQFWLRRQWNRKCTNKDEQRPRLVYISDCKNVTLQDVTLQNSPFWTTHIYNSHHVRITGVHITSLLHPNDSKGPSTDAIDLDAVHDILVRGCYMSVNDDAIAIKGGKGPYADAFEKKYPGVDIPAESEGNGANTRILIDGCTYGEAHSCLTLGSESVHSSNIILRNLNVTEPTHHLLWLKMRPDTPQLYEYITVEDIKGKVGNFIYVAPWKQFFDLKGRKDSPMSYSDHITMRRCDVECETFFNVKQQEEVYHLSNFTFEDLNIHATKSSEFDSSIVENFITKNINVH
ncbi:MAG: exopolygalacturonase [Bacteroidales bacterium]|nr:exopolygalacturonase [Candidatus Liminaster caballi]